MYIIEHFLGKLNLITNIYILLLNIEKHIQNNSKMLKVVEFLNKYIDREIIT